MSKKTKQGWGASTLGIRAAEPRTSEMEHSAAIFPTSSFVFQSAAEAAAVFSGEKAGNIYSRFTNPTVRAFEERLAIMEGGECCVATASGMAAVLATVMTFCKSGDHVLTARSLFGSTISLLNNYFAKLGIATTYVDPCDLAAWEQGFKPNTKLVFVETPTNPLLETADIRALAKLSQKHHALLVVDNAFLTPVLQQPFKLGADIVIHSATKYLDGQGRCVGGAVIGDKERVGKDVFAFLRTAGPSMSPFNAWVFLKGLETLQLRMKAHSENAMKLAQWLTQQRKVTRVFYPGLPDHPQHALARRQQTGFGGVVSFEVKGGRKAAWKVIDSVQMISITANLGDTRSTITHPTTTTHARITPEARAAAGINEGLLRIAVGLENIEDIIDDLKAGLR